MTTAVHEPMSDTVTDERPVHLAKCAECQRAVTFRPSASGASFTLVDADPDATFGIGEHGRPICPECREEMAIADDQLKPVPDAFADAATMLQRADAEASDPVQRTLPGVVPAFNFQGCYMELEQQATIVEALRKEYEDDARVAKDSKKAWDEAEAKFTAMALEFRRRRQARDAEREERAQHPGADVSGRLVACLFEQQQPEETCPFCRGDVAPAVFERLGIQRDQVAPPDANLHVEQARAFYDAADVEVVLDALDSVDHVIDVGLVRGWTKDERTAAISWADFLLRHQKGDTDVVPDRPAVLGTPHVPAKPDADGRQVCALCDEVLVKSSTSGDVYAETAFVGTDCRRKPAPEGHRYPEPVKKARKKAAKQTSGE